MADILKLLGLKKSTAPIRVTGYHGSDHPHGSSLIIPWTRFDNRKKLEEDLTAMDKNCPIIARALDKTADAATCFEKDDTFGFKVVTGQDDGETPSAEQEKAVGIINEMVERTGISGQNCWDLMRDMVKKGNVFTEVVIDDDMTEIEAVKQFRHSWEIQKNVDDSGNLMSGDPSKAVSDPKEAQSAAYTQTNDMGRVVAAFWPYQINHWTFGPLGGELYAEPLGASGVKTYKRFDAGIDSLGVARVTRAWDTNVHHIPVPAGATDDEVAAVLNRYRNSQEFDEVTTYDSGAGNFRSTPRYSPMDVARDIYVPRFYTGDGKIVSGDIEKLLPSTAALEQLGDLELQISLLICTWCVPPEIVGLDVGKKPMVDKTDEEGMEAFSRYIRRLQHNHALGLKTIFDLELLLHGVNPLQQLYKIKYPAISTQTAEAEAKIMMTKAQAAIYYWQMAMPAELIGPRIDLDASQVSYWLANMQKQIAIINAMKSAPKPQSQSTTQPTSKPKPKETK